MSANFTLNNMAEEQKTFYPDQIDDNAIKSTTASEVINAGFDTQKKKMMSDWGFTKSGSLSFYDTDGEVLVKVDSVGFHGYNTSAVETMRVSSTGIYAYGNTADVFNFRATTADSVSYGTLGFSVANDSFYIASGNGKKLYFLGGEGLSLYTSGALSLFTDSDTDGISITTHAGILTLGSGGSDVNITGNDVTMDCDNFVLNGATKAAIVSTSKGYKALYCSESPEVWFFDFCRGRRVTPKWYKPWIKDWLIKPDPLFMESTDGNIIVIPTGVSNMVQVWRKRKGFSNIRFEDKTEEEFHRNNEFWNTPKVDRQVKK